MFSAWANAKRNSAKDCDQSNSRGISSSSNNNNDNNSSSSPSSSSSSSSSSSAAKYKQSSSSSAGIVWSPYQRAPIDMAKRNALYQAESRRNIERLEIRQQARRDARQNKEDLGYYSDK